MTSESTQPGDLFPRHTYSHLETAEKRLEAVATDALFKSSEDRWHKAYDAGDEKGQVEATSDRTFRSLEMFDLLKEAGVFETFDESLAGAGAWIEANQARDPEDQDEVFKRALVMVQRFIAEDTPAPEPSEAPSEAPPPPPPEDSDKEQQPQAPQAPPAEDEFFHGSRSAPTRFPSYDSYEHFWDTSGDQPKVGGEVGDYVQIKFDTFEGETGKCFQYRVRKLKLENVETGTGTEGDPKVNTHTLKAVDWPAEGELLEQGNAVWTKIVCTTECPEEPE